MDEKNKHILPLNWSLIVFILAMYLIGLLMYPHLPDMMPTHWNIKGEVDGYSSKLFYIIFFPSMILGTYLLMTFAPKIDPRADSYKKFTGVVAGFRTLLVIIFSVIYLAPMAVALGYPVSVSKVVRLSIGIMLVFIGNYYGKVRHNYTFGIKTPWTLANEEVWNKTHRFSGPLWLGAGFVWIFSILIRDNVAFIIDMAALMGASILGVVYSYIVYKKLADRR